MILKTLIGLQFSLRVSLSYVESMEPWGQVNVWRGSDVPLFSSSDKSLLAGKSQCEMEALAEILPVCAKKGVGSITPQNRRRIAVMLSVCEFQVSRISYPAECIDLDSESQIDICIRYLELHSQFWTTFSGNYRDVQTICHQYASPFEKDQILALFSNITNLYRHFQKEMDVSNKESSETAAMASSIISQLYNGLHDLKIQYQMFHENMSTLSQARNDELDLIWQKVEKVLEKQEKRLESLMDHNLSQIEQLNNQLHAINGNIDDGYTSMQTLTARISYIFDQLDLQLSNGILNWLQMVNKLEHSLQYGAVNARDLADTLVESNDLISTNQALLEKATGNIISQLQNMQEALDSFMLHFSISAERRFNSIISQSEVKMHHFIEEAMGNMTVAFNNTRGLVNEHARIIEQITSKLAATSKLVHSTILKVSSTIPLKALNLVQTSLQNGLRNTRSIYKALAFGIKIPIMMIGITAFSFCFTKLGATRICASNLVLKVSHLAMRIISIVSVICGISAAYILIKIMESIGSSVSA